VPHRIDFVSFCVWNNLKSGLVALVNREKFVIAESSAQSCEAVEIGALLWCLCPRELALRIRNLDLFDAGATAFHTLHILMEFEPQKRP